MIKSLACIKRRPDWTREAFRDHYEQIHVPLAMPLLAGLARFVRYHVEVDIMGNAEFDALEVCGYRDKAVADRILDRYQSEAADALLEDESLFMDKAATHCITVSERIFHSEEGGEGEAHLFILVSRPQHTSRFDASTNLANEYFPRLLAEMDRPGFALLRDGFPMHGQELIYDSVMQIRTDADPELVDWARDLEGEGYRVDAFRTRRFETRLEN